MKRYLVFIGSKKETLGGTDDLVLTTDNEADALAQGNEDLDGWSDILDVRSGCRKYRREGRIEWSDWARVRV